MIPSSQSTVFMKIPTKNTFNFVHDYRATTLFFLISIRKIISLHLGKYSTSSCSNNKVSEETTPIKNNQDGTKLLLKDQVP